MNNLRCKCNKCNISNTSISLQKEKAMFWKHIDNKNIVQAEQSLRALIQYNKDLNTLKKLGN